MDERREFPRINESVRLNVKTVEGVAPGSALDALAINISGGGIAFPSTEKLEDGAMLALELDLPGFPAGVIAMARVVWVEKNDEPSESHPWLVGAEFHWVGWDSNSAQANIASFIRERLDD